MRQRGMSAILVVVMVIIIFAVVGYFIVSNMNSNNSTTPSSTMISGSALPSSVPVSEDSEVETLQTELEQTSSGEVEIEIQKIDSEASSL